MTNICLQHNLIYYVFKLLIFILVQNVGEDIIAVIGGMMEELVDGG